MANSRVAAWLIPMKSLNLQLRFLAPLLVTLVAAAYFALPVMDRLTLRWFARDLNARGSLVTNTLSDAIGGAISDAKGARLQVLFDRVVQDERLFAIGLCSLDGKMIRSSASFPRTLDCQEAQAVAELREPRLRLRAVQSTSACTRSTARPARSPSWCSCMT
jgi:trehalose 6-phosphate synthase